MTIVLTVFGWLWRLVNRARRTLYRRGVFKSRRLPRPVVSVGNLAAGGAGKTPAVITIARFLTKRGFRVAVLTRGHGRAGNESGVVTSLDASRFGDEPVLLKSILKDATIIVGKNRYENAAQFLASNDCDVFILDDGFQHLQLSRDADVVIDAPHLVMREGRSALAGAGFVIQRHLRLVVPQALTSRRIFAFAGLANNEQFFESLRAANLDLTGSRGFPDHHRYNAADIEAVKREARQSGADAIVTTEKDAVKIDDREIIAIAAEMVIAPEVLEAIAARISR